ncbi:hypothetical protein LY76DRAFT_606288 [Colletotrichum caudatum]|nr:hypothetical protein LY76DRAFT_606288 [Colletotrichum caudatum]
MEDIEDLGRQAFRTIKQEGNGARPGSQARRLVQAPPQRSCMPSRLQSDPVGRRGAKRAHDLAIPTSVRRRRAPRRQETNMFPAASPVVKADQQGVPWVWSLRGRRLYDSVSGFQHRQKTLALPKRMGAAAPETRAPSKRSLTVWLAPLDPLDLSRHDLVAGWVC